MTADEERVLRAYLGRIGAIAEDDFEEWYGQRHESEEGEAEFKAALAEAQAYALGRTDERMLKEVMANTYDTIIRNLGEVLIAERTKRNKVSEDSTGSPWLYLPVGPEGPRPWRD